jgi:hypothetical protein
MPAYILPDDYAAWGLASGATTDVLVAKASLLVDTHCHRTIGEKVYTERLTLPEDRNLARLTYTPFLEWDTDDTNNPTGVRGRYAFGRRSGAMAQPMQDPSLLLLTAPFGGPPAWFNVDTGNVDVFPATGEVWFPAGIYMAYYNEVEVRYRAGYADIPDDIKLAVTMLIQAFQTRQPGAKAVKAGDRALQFFDAKLVDAQVAAVLEPYRARALR